MNKHKDILGNELKVGDIIVTHDTYYKELNVRIIESFTPKGISARRIDVKTKQTGAGHRIILNVQNSVCKIKLDE